MRHVLLLHDARGWRWWWKGRERPEQRILLILLVVLLLLLLIPLVLVHLILPVLCGNDFEGGCCVSNCVISEEIKRTRGERRINARSLRHLSANHKIREKNICPSSLLRGCATHSLHGVVWDMEGHILYPDLTRGASRRGERRGAKKEAFHRSSGTGSRRGRSFIRQRISSSPCIGLNCAVLNLAPFEKRSERS